MYYGGEQVTITRYVNGKEISDEEFYKLKISNPIIKQICTSVIQRVRKEEKISRHEKLEHESS